MVDEMCHLSLRYICSRTCPICATMLSSHEMASEARICSPLGRLILHFIPSTMVRSCVNLSESWFLLTEAVLVVIAMALVT
jgi:hypothetical protein